MRNNKIGTLVRSVLAVALLVGTQWAAAEVVAGTIVKFSDGVGNYPGGAFNGSVVSGGSGTFNNTFESFCLETTEYLNPNGTTLYKVDGVTGQTLNAAGTPDPISAQTAWLFTQFFNKKLTNTAIWGAANQTDKNTAVQQAIWTLEGESFSGLTGLATSYVSLANLAVSSGAWSGIGDVRVLNLFSKDGHGNYTQHAQDQIYMVSSVPEPETYALMLAGLALVGGIARRRRSKVTSD